MKAYSVWSEGFIVTGNRSDATYHGTINAPSFRVACDHLFHDDITYDPHRLTLWACKLFDNEDDARKAYG
jgi:hypothetical protein